MISTLENFRPSSLIDQLNLIKQQVESSDIEKEQLKNEIKNLKELLQESDSLRQRAMTAESKITILQQMNNSLSQQINDLTVQNANLVKDISQLQNQYLIDQENGQIKNRFAAAQAQISMTQQESFVYSNEIKQLKNTIIEMQTKHQQELDQKDNIINKLQKKINNLECQIKENQKKIKTQNRQNQTEAKPKEQNQNQPQNQFFLLTKKYEASEEKMKNKIKKTKKQLEELQRKFHLLKKKYVEKEKEHANVQSTYQAAIIRADSISSELKKQKSYIEDLEKKLAQKEMMKNVDIEEFNQLKYEYEELHNQLMEAEQIISQAKDDNYALKQKVEKDEGELIQLRCLMKIMSGFDGKNSKGRQYDENIFDQIESLNQRLNNLDRENHYQNENEGITQNPPPRKAFPTTRKKISPSPRKTIRRSPNKNGYRLQTRKYF